MIRARANTSRAPDREAVSKDRRAARQLALDILYQAEIRDQLPSEALSLRREAGWILSSDEERSVPSEDAIRYATQLVEGVESDSATIDELIARVAERWALERMPVVDRNVLRLALYELLAAPDVPTAVVINEAIELVKSLSTEESGRFINGILGRVAQEVR